MKTQLISHHCQTTASLPAHRSHVTPQSRRIRRRFSPPILMLLALLMVLLPAPPAAAHYYAPADITAPAGGSFRPDDINDHGQLAGGYTTITGNYVLLTPSSNPPEPQVPAPPAYIYAYPGNGAVDLTWPAPYFATGFNVKRATVSGGPYTTIAAGVSYNAFTDTSVTNGTRYYYVVSSVNGAFESANSPETSALPLAPPIGPASLRATAAKGGKSVTLTWTQSSSPAIQANRVYRSANGGAWTQVAQINAATPWLDRAVSRNVTYSYKVTALNVNSQESPFSNTVSVRAK